MSDTPSVSWTDRLKEQLSQHRRPTYRERLADAEAGSRSRKKKIWTERAWKTGEAAQSSGSRVELECLDCASTGSHLWIVPRHAQMPGGADVESDFGVTWPKGAFTWPIVVVGGAVADRNPGKAGSRACISTT